jgi:hypothetical protein
MPLRNLSLALAVCCAPLIGQTVTYNKNLAPIVYSHCSPCHRPGEAAPFSLLSYSDVRKHSGQIVDLTSKRYMPPWMPDYGYGDFSGSWRRVIPRTCPKHPSSPPDGSSASRT